MHTHNGTTLPASRPFTIAGRQYPANWLSLASAADLADAGIVYTPDPQKPLHEVQAEKLAKIRADRNAAITGGFVYLNKPIDSDRDSVMAITGAAVAALAAKAAGLPYSVTWTCADDSTLTLDADGVLGMSVTLAQFADAQHTKGRPLKDAIKNATAVEQVEAVVWFA